MSQIESAAARTKANFFTNTKPTTTGADRINKTVLPRTSEVRKSELETATKADSKVTIPDAIKDFSRIKKAVDAAPEIDNTDKIAKLKAEISAGTYKVDYDGLANKILEQEF